MKKLYNLAVFLFLFNIFCKAQYVSIPDANFQFFLSEKYPGCFNGGGLMDTTCAAIITEDSLIFGYQNIANLSGIQYFDSLRYLDCSYNIISDIPMFPASLDTLIIKEQLDGNTGVPYMVPVLFNLPVLPAGLRYFDCSNNGLGGLGNLPASLEWLNCSNNYVWILGGPGERTRPCFTTITNLPISLKYLKCDNNALTQLPPLPPSLVFLDCSVNAYYFEYDEYIGPPTIYSNPGIGNFTSFPASLNYIDISSNRPTQLPALPPVIAHLNIWGTSIKCLPELPQSFSGQSPYSTSQYNLLLPDSVNCLPNAVPGIRTTYTYPLCNVTNNIHGCISNPVITGNIFYDNNSNGIRDAGEFPREGVEVSLGNGQTAFSDINGDYSLSGILGSNTLNVQPPVYYNAVPPSITYNFTTNDSLVTSVIVLQPNTIADSVKIIISPLDAARPGFSFSYNVKYENVGTTTVNPQVVINYDNTKLLYSNSTNASVINNGSLLTLSLNNVSPGQRGEFTSYFTIIPTAALGSIITTTAVVTAGSNSSTNISNSIVQGSFDPNDKQATPSLSVVQVASGEYIDYLVRFQNTGTDMAFNIVITDTLSSLLQENTFQITGSSHSCRSRRYNDTLSFEFLNIMLPDSNVNEPGSHGYIRFRVRPQSSLPDNTIIPNRASIYFDYNLPVLTGNASTIVNLSAIPIRLSNFNVRKENKYVTISWVTGQEINSKEFIVERSAEGNIWNEVSKINAAGNSSQKITYSVVDYAPSKGINYYRLKQIDLDNRIAYSPIKSVYFGNDANILLVPNPARENVTIYMPGNQGSSVITIFNANNQVVKQFSTTEESIQVKLTGFAKGIYTVKVNGKNINEVRKLLVK